MRRPVPATTAAAILLHLAAGGVATSSLGAQPGSFAGPVPVERLTARRQALADRIGAGVAVLAAAPERDEDGRDHPQDNFYRQDNDFFYLTGLETPNSWLVIVARDSAPDETILFIPPRDTLKERWWGPQLVPGPEVQRLTGIQDVRANTGAAREIRRLVMQGGSPARHGTLLLKRTPEWLRNSLLRELNEIPDVRVDDLSRTLAAMRLVKDADEIKRIRQATDLTIEGHLAAWRAAKPGVWERELEADAEATWRRLGAERNAYPSIVGGGPRSVHLHLTDNRGQLKDGDVVVMDAAAEHGYYKSDVTRTFPVNGRFTPRQRAIYDLVLGAQQAAIDSVRPGITIGRLNAISRQYMRAHSRDLCGGDSCDRYFIHGLSHWIGLDVHDVGSYNVPLAPGMVFSVEPGITLASEGFRIGIEDVILVTPTGSENLSAKLPRRAEDIEAYMRTPRVK
jgi:Xaa-Pro aminopeptidase